MILSLSTHWNANRFSSGELMIEEILELGFDHVELGYDLTLDLAAGVHRMVKEKSVTVNSLHNYCPVPIGAMMGHPEIFLMASLDDRERKSAILNTLKTVEFAAEIGAHSVVVHAGRISTKIQTRKLMELARAGKQYKPKFETLKIKLLMQREKKAAAHIDQLYKSIEEMLPTLEKTKVKICIENLPSWETVPCESEAETLMKHFDSPYIRCWHDIGHGQMRENMGFVGNMIWLGKLKPWLAGMHVHDVIPPATDHVMPPDGNIDFKKFQPFVGSDVLKVLEPAPNTPAEKLRKAKALLEEIWGG